MRRVCRRRNKHFLVNEDDASILHVVKDIMLKILQNVLSSSDIRYVCLFHSKWNFSHVIHGDDFTVLGSWSLHGLWISRDQWEQLWIARTKLTLTHLLLQCCRYVSHVTLVSFLYCHVITTKFERSNDVFTFPHSFSSRRWRPYCCRCLCQITNSK